MTQAAAFKKIGSKTDWSILDRKKRRIVFVEVMKEQNWILAACRESKVFSDFWQIFFWQTHLKRKIGKFFWQACDSLTCPKFFVVIGDSGNL